jgi:glycine oxidase
MKRIAIIGGGIIGLSLGWQLARKGKKVEVLERGESGRGAAWVAAGMLAPQAEMGFEEIELFNLCRKSLDLYPKFLEELYEDSGLRVEVEWCGTLLVGFHRDDNERLRRFYNFRERVGLPVEWMTGSEARELEPSLSPKCSAAIWIKDDAQIDNRSLLDALRKAFVSRGGELYDDHNVERINIENEAVKSVHIHGIDIENEAVVVCAGSWSKQISGIPENLLPPVRPVKGQIISLTAGDGVKLNHAIRAPDVYLVPKKDGRLVVGASVEEMGFDTRATAGEIFRMLERAWEAVPSIYELPIKSIDVGLRPGSKDHQPIIGDCEIKNLYFATGHHRNGILLAPMTAYELSEWIITGKKSEHLAPFQLSRFAA